MDDEILARQRLEWDDFYNQRNLKLRHVIDDERLIRRHHGQTSDILTSEWQEKLVRDRKAWTEEWGIEGSRTQALRRRHQREWYKDTVINHYTPGRDRPTAAEIDKMYDDHLRSEKESERALQTQIRDHGNIYSVSKDLTADAPAEVREHQRAFEHSHTGHVLRDSLLDEMVREQEEVTHFYESRADQPVPAATLRRMEKHQAEFRQEWDGMEPKIPLADWQTLDDYDHSHEFQSWYDMKESHEIIERLYGSPDELPQATRQRMAKEETEYFSEVDAHRQRQQGLLKEHSSAKEAGQNDAGVQFSENRESGFKEQLAAIRERNSRPHIPRPH